MDIMLIAKIVIVTTAFAGAIAYKVMYKAPNDNPIEQLAEEVIKQATGVEIDLSPEKKE